MYNKLLSKCKLFCKFANKLLSEIPANFYISYGGALLNVIIPTNGKPQKFIFNGENYIIKNEQHVTLVGTSMKLDKKIKEIHKLSNKEASIKLQEALIKAKSSLSFTISLLNDFRIVTNGDRKSIIQMCNVTNSKEFYENLEKELGIHIEEPPFHVTLYTKDGTEGIGIPSMAVLNLISKPFNESILQE